MGNGIPELEVCEHGYAAITCTLCQARKLAGPIELFPTPKETTTIFPPTFFCDHHKAQRIVFYYNNMFALACGCAYELSTIPPFLKCRAKGSYDG